MNFHHDVLAAHAEFGGDLESMQKLYEYPDLKAEVERLRMALDEIATDDEYRDLTAEEAKAVAKKALAAPTKASGGDNV